MKHVIVIAMITWAVMYVGCVGCGKVTRIVRPNVVDTVFVHDTVKVCPRKHH